MEIHSDHLQKTRQKTSRLKLLGTKGHNAQKKEQSLFKRDEWSLQPNLTS